MAGSVASGTSRRNAPSPVAMPLPPRNNRKGDQQLPAMAATAAAAPATGVSPANAAPADTARYPLAASPTSVSRAAARPADRSTLVAPMLPLPLLRRSTTPKARATISPIGMAPMR